MRHHNVQIYYSFDSDLGGVTLARVSRDLWTENLKRQDASNAIQSVMGEDPIDILQMAGKDQPDDVHFQVCLHSAI